MVDDPLRPASWYRDALQDADSTSSSIDFARNRYGSCGEQSLVQLLIASRHDVFIVHAISALPNIGESLGQEGS